MVGAPAPGEVPSGTVAGPGDAVLVFNGIVGAGAGAPPALGAGGGAAAPEGAGAAFNGIVGAGAGGLGAPAEGAGGGVGALGAGGSALSVTRTVSFLTGTDEV